MAVKRGGKGLSSADAKPKKAARKGTKAKPKAKRAAKPPKNKPSGGLLAGGVEVTPPAPGDAAGRPGRPAKYTDKLAREILERMADGELLNQICRDAHMPDSRTVRRWRLDDVSGFSPRYARARTLQLEFWADELVEIADDGRNDWVERERDDGSKHIVFAGEHVQRSRLRTDTRKWMLARLLSSDYSERVKVDHGAQSSIGELLGELDGATGRFREQAA